MDALQSADPDLQAVFLNVLDHLPPESTETYLRPFARVTGFTPDPTERQGLLAALGAQLKVANNEIIHSDEIYQLRRNTADNTWRLVFIHPAPIL